MRLGNIYNPILTSTPNLENLFLLALKLVNKLKMDLIHWLNNVSKLQIAINLIKLFLIIIQSQVKDVLKNLNNCFLILLLKIKKMNDKIYYIFFNYFNNIFNSKINKIFFIKFN